MIKIWREIGLLDITEQKKLQIRTETRISNYFQTQEKWSVVISNKNGICKLPHELLINLKVFRILELVLEI